MRSHVPLWAWCMFIGLVLCSVLVGVGKRYLVEVEVPRSFVALELVVERDAEGNVTKVHRFRMDNGGRVDFPDLPYYASLRLNCRDCPQQVGICPADIDGDGIIGAGDLVIMMAAWGTCAP